MHFLPVQRTLSTRLQFCNIKAHNNCSGLSLRCFSTAFQQSKVPRRRVTHQCCPFLCQLCPSSRFSAKPMLAFLFSGSWSRGRKPGIAPWPTQVTSSHCIIRSYRDKKPAHSPVSRLGTFADPGTPSGYKTGHVWTTPFSNRLCSSH